MRNKILYIVISMLFVVSALAISVNEGKEENSIKNEDFLINNGPSNILQGQWVSMRSFNNYAQSKMPDFDQRQDSWQKIDAGPNQQINSIVSGDDILVGVTCIAPGNNAHLDSSASGDDLIKWYFCGPTATANALWYIDSRHEKNDYPDNNQDSCDLVTKYAGIADDHSTSNVPKLIEDLASNFLGTSGKCTTNVRDIASGAWNYINNSKLMGQYKVIVYDQDNITMNNLTSWMQFCGTIILRLDTPERGHFVTLQAVNSVTNQIIISDPDFDASNPAVSHTQHNNASIVSHDTYTINPPNLRVLNYPEDPCFITHAVNIWKKPLIDCIFVYPHRTIDMGDDGTELVHIINVDQPTDDCLIYYYLQDGIEYAGGALVNGVPNEPLIEGGILKWCLPGMYPGQLYELEFQITATSPRELELERRVRTWAYAPSISTEIYDDDFGSLEINDEVPPTIENVFYVLFEYYIMIYANVYDNMLVDQVKVIITDPDQGTTEYDMIKFSGNDYQISIDTSGWESGEYSYYVWAKDLAGNEQTSDEYNFYISDELLAIAGGPYEGIVGESVQFNGSAIGGNPPYSYEWNFGDENTSNEQNPMHTYTESGEYIVNLTVTDDNQDTAQDTTTASISINNPPTIPSINGKIRGKYGEPHEYSFQSTDPEGDDVSYVIDWGDGSDELITGPFQSGLVIQYSHTFEEEGSYTIRAKSKDTHNAESDWGTLPVKMPKNKFNFDIFPPMMDKIIQYFLLIYSILGLKIS